MNSELIETEKLIDALEYCVDEERYSKILEIIISILNPLVIERKPRALWLKSRLPNLGETLELEDEVELEQKWLDLVKESASHNCKEAQYQYACYLYDQNKVKEATLLYKASADAGYAPSQWCFGLGCINGLGTPKNIDTGIFYIRLSAEQRYEDAVDFILNAVTKELHGLEKDVKEVNKWKMVAAQLSRVEEK